MTEPQTSAGRLSRDNPESRWHTEQRTKVHRKSWACVPLTDAVTAEREATRAVLDRLAVAVGGLSDELDPSWYGHGVFSSALDTFSALITVIPVLRRVLAWPRAAVEYVSIPVTANLAYAIVLALLAGACRRPRGAYSRCRRRGARSRGNR